MPVTIVDTELAIDQRHHERMNILILLHLWVMAAAIGASLPTNMVAGETAAATAPDAESASTNIAADNDLPTLPECPVVATLVPVLSESDLRSDSTNDGYAHAKKVTEKYHSYYNLPKFDDCTAAFLCCPKYIGSFAKWLVEVCKKMTNPNEGYKLGSCLQFVSGHKVMIERKFNSPSSPEPRPQWLSKENEDVYIRFYSDVNGYIIRNVIVKSWKDGQNASVLVPMLCRPQMRHLCRELFGQANTPGFAARDCLDLTLTWQAAGRGSEVVFCTLDEIYLIEPNALPVMDWKQSKNVIETPFVLIPDIWWEMNVLHTTGVYLALEQEAAVGQQPNNMLFSVSVNHKQHSKKTSDVIKRLARDSDFRERSGVTTAMNAKSIREAACALLSTKIPNYFLQLSRSGHEKGLDKKYPFLTYAACNHISNITATIPGGAAIGGHKNPMTMTPQAASFDLVTITVVEAGRLQSVATQLFNLTNFPYCHRGQPGRPFVMVLLATLVMHISEVTAAFPSHRYIVRFWTAFLDNGFTIARVEEIGSELQEQVRLRNTSVDNTSEISGILAQVAQTQAEQVT